MNDKLKMIPDELFGHQRPIERPQVNRVRFTPTPETAEFLAHCNQLGYDISTIINLAIHTFKPKTTPAGFTWEGIKSVL